MNIPENFDRWMFDYMEGNLSSVEAEVFEQFLVNNPSYEADMEAWQNATIPQHNMQYPGQNSLTKNRKPILWWGWGSAAAALVALVGIGSVILLNAETGTSKVASQLNGENSAMNHVAPQTGGNEIAATNENMLNAYGTNENAVSNQGAESNASTSATNPLTTSVAASNPFIQRNDTRIAGSNDSNGGSYTENNTESTAQTGGSESQGTSLLAYSETTVSESGEVLENEALSQEIEKYDSDKYDSKYANNPEVSVVDLELNKLSNFKLNSFANKSKNLYRKIERMLDYPVGLVNLRDPELLVPDYSLIASNPGFVGGLLKPRVELSYRNQWLGADANSHRTIVSFDNYVKALRGGFGVIVKSENLNNGALGNHSISLAYSPKIKLGEKSVLEPAIKGTVGILTGDAAEWAGQAFEIERGLVLSGPSPTASTVYSTQLYKDFGVGVVLNTEWFYVGLSADNLSNHFVTPYRLEGNVEPQRSPVLFNGIIGSDYESKNKKNAVSPFIAARMYGERKEVWAGANFRLDWLTIGGGYSTNHDYTASLGMKFKNFKLVYQYDQTQTLLSNEQIGSHNLGIRFNGAFKNDRFKY